MKTRYFPLLLSCLLSCLALQPSTYAQSKSNPVDKFKQLEEVLPTPTEYRSASGAPGHRYWQQRADYKINVELDDAKQRIIGSETITYYNQSPDTLNYLWLQLDQNIFAADSDANRTRTAPVFEKEELPESQAHEPKPAEDKYRVTVELSKLQAHLPSSFEGGYRITAVRDDKGAPLPHSIVKTMMRINLKSPLAPGQAVSFSIDWSYNVTDQRRAGGRTGYEFFPKDGNYLYEIAHWFPRLAAYNDVSGWQHKQFLGSGEFTLEFGNYRVSITAPDDHIVASTGVLQNPQEVLTKAQRDRLEQAKTAKSPVLIVTPDEARANERGRPKGKKTWVFHADNVRDFAFASSRKFIWDAQQHDVEGNRVMAMSYYPKEGNPLWEKYSTQAIIHTLNVYSRYSFTYPYPVAISVNGPVGGMEYPMICFNGPRPEEDGTYTAKTKYSLISVVIHEVGHNYFPMIVNSDERQWTWMDEGLNTFLQYLSEQEWESNYPSRRGEPKNITEYMLSGDQVPIMTNSESVLQFGNNAYAKPATALNILRETVLGRELFDYSFREYSRRWKFKRPMPSDFFRSMEDASGIDLDWFWRGWFYSTDHTDISIESVRLYRLDSQNPDLEKPEAMKERDARPETLSAQRNRGLPKRNEQFPSLNDFYNTYDELVVTDRDREEYRKFLSTLTQQERDLLSAGLNFYVVELKNIGGLVMPVIFGIEYADGTKEEMRIPAEIWRYNNSDAAKMIVTGKEIKSIVLDPHLETADVDMSNNYFPHRPVKSKFQLFKEAKTPNPMQLIEKKPTPQQER
ncbi:MAG TPA: M1 family metallopeptidase [Blastocatellia bacterium]|nr:M1 family metallopeptidase [Blastocatellia bacterium]